MKKILFPLISLLVGCGSPTTEHRGAQTTEITHARGFTLETFDGYTVARVRDPWDTTRTLHTYVLVPKKAPLPESLPDGDLIRTPVEKAAVASGVHCTLLEAVGCGDAVRAVCQPEYISHRFVKEGIEAGTVADIGAPSQIDVERLIGSGAELIVMSPFEGVSYGAVEKSGIPIVECASYMETEPLGQTEWLKFHAAFYGRLPEADSLFRCIEARYNAVRDTASAASSHPVLLAERRVGQVWYVPGGGSYAANLYRDAGTVWPWSDNDSAGSLSLGFEQVVDRAADADVWLIRYHDPSSTLTYDDLRDEYPLYELFKPFGKRKIFTCNTAVTPYYETAIVNPDKVLSDIVRIAHPELLTDTRLYYYSPMPEDNASRH
ncbi:MAG: ABC transporter substrate-binding protein [Rikenellaceae bacterium]|nr:ABC transporter substrate-binding protein [Rikenellaceae bacterium]